jgi:hypothetical protein
MGRDYGTPGGAEELPRFPMPPRDEPILPGMEKPAPQPTTTPFPQPLVGTLPGTPVKKPGGGGGG